MAGDEREQGTERELGRKRERKKAGTRNRRSVMGGRVSPFSSWIPLQPPFPGISLATAPGSPSARPFQLSPSHLQMEKKRPGQGPQVEGSWRGKRTVCCGHPSTEGGQTLEPNSQSHQEQGFALHLRERPSALWLELHGAGGRAGADPRCKGLSRRRQRTGARWSAAGQVNL